MYVFREFSYSITCMKRYNFIKLLHIVYQGRSVWPKSKPLLYLYVSLVLIFESCFSARLTTLANVRLWFVICPFTLEPFFRI